MSSSGSSDDDANPNPLRVPVEQPCRLHGREALSLASWWSLRQQPSDGSLQSPAPPAPPQPPESEDLWALLLAVFRVRHLRIVPMDEILAIAIRQALGAQLWTKDKMALEAQVQQLQQQLQLVQSTATLVASATVTLDASNPSTTSTQAAQPMAIAHPAAGRKRLLEHRDDEQKSSASSSVARAVPSESMLDVAPVSSSLSSASSASVAAAAVAPQSTLHAASLRVSSLSSIAQSSGVHKKPRTEGGLSTAALPRRPFSAPAVSVSVVMQFLQLEEVARAMIVSRQWCAAALDPLVWSDRPTWAWVANASVQVQVITSQHGLAGQHAQWKYRPRSLQSYAHLRLLRRVRSMCIVNVSMDPAQLALVRESFPSLTEIRTGARWLEHAQVLTQGHLRHAVLFADLYVLPTSVGPDDPWPSFVQTIARCSELRQLVLHTVADVDTRLSPADFTLLLHSVPQLEALEVKSDQCTHGITLTAPVHLRSLKLSLTVSQVERMCGAAAMLPILCTLEIIIGYKDRDHDARDRAAAQFKLASDSPLLTPSRLSCLARLPALLHLTCVLPSCAVDPLLPIRLAQQSDASAFQCLHSYTYVGEDRYVEGTICQNSAGEAIFHSASAVDLIPLRSLRSLHLSCCHSTLLGEENQIAALCTVFPNVQTLVLQCHRANTMSLSWCHFAAIQSLRCLGTLVIQQPEATQNFTAEMLFDLHALSRLPALITFELVDVVRSNRLDLADLLTLRDPGVDSLESLPPLI